MPFTIPSGIIMTEISCAERLLKMIPEIGIWTTKSIGPRPRIVPTGEILESKPEGVEFSNREPIFAQYSPGCFINAVGLTNPGAEEFKKKLIEADIPKDRFILASIIGKNKDEFIYVAKILEDVVDGFEINLSCPHAKGYGMQLGQDPEIVFEIIRAVSETTKKPVFAKLTPNASNIAAVAEVAMKAGAYGISAINTVGPGCYMFEGYPVLTNKVGGLSGKGITPIGIKCVRDIVLKLGKIPVIGMGGISTAKDVQDYSSVGASIFGIGSVLAGMTDAQIKDYFKVLVQDLDNKTNSAEKFLRNVDMEFKKVRITKQENHFCDFKIFKTNASVNALPGQFVFARISELGEKPFSIMNDNPLTLGVLTRGLFTKKFNELKEGDEFYIRGPYGQPTDVPQGSNVVLVGGGCGIAGLYLAAKKFSKKANVTVLLGAKDKEHLAYLDEFRKYGEVLIATEDGSIGEKGMVSDILKKTNLRQESYFFNCGPKQMIEAVLPLELEKTTAERVYSSVDYMTMCGVGICGRCVDGKGRRTCVEGPFMRGN